MNYWLEQNEKKEKERKKIYKNSKHLSKWSQIWYKSIKNYWQKKTI